MKSLLTLHYHHLYIVMAITDSGASQYREVRVCDFLMHTRNLHANSDVGFSTEFEEIAANTRTNLTAENSDLPENKHKNRYVNISACKLILSGAVWTV